MGRLRFFAHLYWGKDIPEKDQLQIKWRLKVYKPSYPVYLVTLPQGSDQLDIVNSLFLHESYYRKNPPFVVGIARSKDGAFELVREMMQECVSQTGAADMLAYLGTLS
ncbi:MAG: hypothetical protein K6G23_06560 [Lachnospiraceae bacterium]|nr:hypothetical protein [Lachnospiraceae bacterium]